MKDNPPSGVAVPPWVRLLINAVYALCAVVGVVVGLYGLYILVAGVLIVEELNLLELVLGLPLTAAGFGLLGFALNMLFSRWYSDARYRTRTWVLALLGAAGLGLGGYLVFVSLRGI